MEDDGRIHLLLVEDDLLDALNVQRAFRGVDAVESVTVAQDGVEAINLLRSGAFPLRRLVILIDLRMPRMNGLEFLREIRHDPKLHWLPVVVLTTSADEEDRAQAYRMNVAGYFLKPVNLGAFKQAMSTFTEYWSKVTFPRA
ncbi:MAG TPA: response regulator [Haliangiales bacterium]|nr:response regulator [Haliangiales bacterium]